MIDTNKIECKKVPLFLLKSVNKADMPVKFFTYKQYRELVEEEPETISETGFVLYVPKKGLSVICINEKQPPDQKIFTIAHDFFK